MPAIIRITLGPNAFARARVAIAFAAVTECRGNVTHAARLLGVHRQALQRVINRPARVDRRRRRKR